MSLVRRCRISLTDYVQELEVLVRPHGLILETAAGCRLMQGNGGAKIRDSVILRLARSQIGHMPSLGSNPKNRAAETVFMPTRMTYPRWIARFSGLVIQHARPVTAGAISAYPDAGHAS